MVNGKREGLKSFDLWLTKKENNQYMNCLKTAIMRISNHYHTHSHFFEKNDLMGARKIANWIIQ